MLGFLIVAQISQTYYNLGYFKYNTVLNLV